MKAVGHGTSPRHLSPADAGTIVIEVREESISPRTDFHEARGLLIVTATPRRRLYNSADKPARILPRKNNRWPNTGKTSRYLPRRVVRGTTIISLYPFAVALVTVLCSSIKYIFNFVSRPLINDPIAGDETIARRRRREIANVHHTRIYCRQILFVRRYRLTLLHFGWPRGNY